jgi:hypothetical protein
VMCLRGNCLVILSLLICDYVLYLPCILRTRKRCVPHPAVLTPSGWWWETRFIKTENRSLKILGMAHGQHSNYKSGHHLNYFEFDFDSWGCNFVSCQKDVPRHDIQAHLAR